MATVGIVEDHLLLAETLCGALRLRDIDAIVYGPREHDSLLAELVITSPDLVLLDLDLGKYGDATPLISPLTALNIRVLVVTGTTDRLRIARALEAGAVGFQTKSAAFDTLLDSATAALESAPMRSPIPRDVLLRELATSRAAGERSRAAYLVLSERERATLAALAGGRSARQIAEAWVVSEATVRSHIRGVLTKLHVSSQLAAVALARSNGWISPN